MDWIMDKNLPICPQLCEKLCMIIATGEISPGERLLSVREIALKAGVNPNTVQKSLEQLEHKGVIFSRRGSGWYVSESIDIARSVLQELIHSKTTAYLSDMRMLGLNEEEILTVIKEGFRCD